MQSRVAIGQRIGVGWVPALGIFALGILYLMRPFITDGLISGSRTDTFIQIAILQNWSNCFSGLGHCLAPNYFFPFDSTLGYNDGYLISGVIFHIFRMAGFDPFIAYELSYVTVRLIGYCAVINLCVRFLTMPLWAAILAAWLGLISINLFNQIEHTQLLYGAFVPLGFYLLLHVLDRFAHRLTAFGWLASLASLSAAWAITAFYSFFYFFLVTIFFLFMYAVFRPRIALDIVHGLTARRGNIAAVVLSAVLTPLSVWIVYGSTLMKFGGHTWNTVYSPRLYDFFNVGPQNLVWSTLLSKAYSALSGLPMGYSELAVGFPPLFIGAILFSALQLAMLARQLPVARSVRDDHAGLVLAVGLAALISVLIVLVVGKVSIWRLYWNILPGAKAIRVPSRFLIFATPLLAMAVAYVIAKSLEKLSANARRGALAMMFLLLSIEQYNKNPVFAISRQAELEFFNSIPTVPQGCRSFYISKPRYGPSGSPEFDRFYAHSVDAMMIAALRLTPTVNGMGSFQPQGWDLAAPFEQDYESRVAAYSNRYQVTDGLCALSLGPIAWRR